MPSWAKPRLRDLGGNLVIGDWKADMMILADSGSLTRCPECCSMRRSCDVGRVVSSTGDLRARSRRRVRFHLKCGSFIEALRPQSSARHAVEGSVDMLGCVRATKRDASVKCWGPKVKMRIRVDHQIAFGEHMALLGSSESAGSWNNRVMMGWTEAGWVVNLEADPGETIEYKYVIVQGNGNLVWENGANRVLIVPDDFSKYYQVVSRWNITNETVDFEVIDTFQALESGATRAGTGATPAGEEITNKPYNFGVIDGTQSPEDGEAEAKKEVTGQTVDFQVIDGTQFQEDWAAEAKTEVMNETVDLDVIDGTISPEDGATKARKEVTNDPVYSEFIEGSRGPEGAVTKVEKEKLKEDGSASLNLEKSECPNERSSVVGREETSSVRSIEVPRRGVGKRDAKGQDNSCKTTAHDDQNSVSWWGKAAIFVILLIIWALRASFLSELWRRL